MSDMKCTKCNSDLEQIGDFFVCTNPHCTLCGDKNIWQELITTRKALDLAITELKNVVEDDDFDIYMRQLSAQTTLEQINETKGDK